MCVQDLRLAVRRLRRSPVFSAVAVLVLAIGIGGVAGSFSIIDAFLLRPLPYDQPERLVHLFRTDPQTGADQMRFSLPAVNALRKLDEHFEDLGAYFYGGRNLSGGEAEPEHLVVANGGRLVAPLTRGSDQQLVLFEKADSGEVTHRAVGGVRFVPLR